MRVVVLGAAGQLGREVVRVLAEREHTVCAGVRRPPIPGFDRSVEVRIADARNKADVSAAMSGADRVVNVIGGGTLRRNDVASTTTAVAVSAALDAGIERYLAISAGMVAVEWPFFKYVLRPLIFRHILAEHNRVEEIVKGTTLAWTIARPSALTNRSPTGYVASLKLQPRTYLTARADLAAFIADELETNQYVRQPVFITSRGEKQKATG
jgi:uncharacterized protein YbjT (DUF2867 family)